MLNSSVNMEYFVIQVVTGKEDYFQKYLKGTYPEIHSSLIWLRKELTIRKTGKISKKVTSIFPGYLFYEAESLGYDELAIFKSAPGFCRFLKTNQDIRPLPERERRLVFKLLSGGEIVGESNVVFDANDRIKVISGPMKDLEGKIIKVDKRKKRAKIKLNLYENSFTIDFGFKIIELMKEEPSNNGK